MTLTVITQAQMDALLGWHATHLKRVEYDENAPTRLHYATLADLLTATDCSGDAIRTARHFWGVDTDATYTGNLWNKGQLVTADMSAVAAHRSMLPGDFVFYHWRGWSLNPGDPFNHVNIYAGGDLVYNHGGDGKGPVRESLKENVSRAEAVRVIRLVKVQAATTNVPSDVPNSTEEDMTPAQEAKLDAVEKTVNLI